MYIRCVVISLCLSLPVALYVCLNPALLFSLAVRAFSVAMQTIAAAAVCNQSADQETRPEQWSSSDKRQGGQTLRRLCCGIHGSILFYSLCLPFV